MVSVGKRFALALVVVYLVFMTAFGIHLWFVTPADWMPVRHRPGSLEAGMWRIVNESGPIIWYFKSFCALVCVGCCLFIPSPPHRVVMAARYAAMLGMLMIGLSKVFNTALGPFGDLVFWPAFTLWLGTTVWCMWPQMRAEMRTKGPGPERILVTALLDWTTKAIRPAKPTDDQKG